MAIPCYPSLSSYAGSLTEPEEVIPSLLKVMFNAPSTSSDLYEDGTHNYKLSFRRLEADYGTVPDALCNALADELSTVINRYFPTRNIVVNTYYKYILDDDSEVEPTYENRHIQRYNVYIDIQESQPNGTTTGIISPSRIELDEQNHIFKVHYTNELNMEADTRIGVNINDDYLIQP